MSQRQFNSIGVILGVILGAMVAAPLAHAADATLGQDLKATIVLQGHTCDQIASSQRNGDSDYSVTCKDGNRYRISVNAQGRVVVEKQ